jgi:hypothetical protein
VSAFSFLDLEADCPQSATCHLKFSPARVEARLWAADPMTRQIAEA